MTLNVAAPELPPSVLDAIAPLPAGYLDLLARVTSVCAIDRRVRALWVGGSIARGFADAGSDLDVLVAVADDELTGFAAGWRGWLEALTPTLLARELPDMPGSFFATTVDCLRLDAVVESVSALAVTPYRVRLAVFDRDGLHARLPESYPPSSPDQQRVGAIVDEFYRQQAIFPAAVVARDDWLLGVVAVHNMQILLYQLFAACNEPLPMMGVKQWGSRLTAAQRALLADLPQPRAERTEVLAAMEAVRVALRDEGRRAADMLGLAWPERFDGAVADYWEREGLCH